MEFLLTPQAWLSAIAIFFLRISDMSLDTIRVLFVMRGRKGLVWIIGLVQSLIFVIAITRVLANLDNPLNVIGYAAGFATGNYIGIMIEDRLAIGHVLISIISTSSGAEIAEKLRAGGYGVTEISARGKDGMVSVIHCNILRRETARVENLIMEIDPTAFITREDVRPVRRGFWRA